jgi:dolichyl-diphosphooligosaccharide--protein glycosyltransferase
MPSFSNKITEAFTSFKNESYDNSSIVVTWWDFGYWLNYFSGLSSVHDGGSQRSPKTYLVAKSLTSTEQLNSYNMINYLVSADSQKITADTNKSYEFFNDQISNSKNIDRPVYLFLSREMIGWWSTITYLGNWDIINGKEKDKTVFERIDCKPKSSVEMICGNAILNINSGSISNGNQLDSLVITQDGSQIRRYDYRNKKGEVSLLIDIVGKNRSFYVVSPETLDSTFSKLFLLNLPKNEFFSLIKDEYPFYRIFKIN